MDQIVNRPVAAPLPTLARPPEPEPNEPVRRRGWSRMLVILLVLAAAAGAGWWWLRPTTTVVSYETTPAARSSLTVEVSATGTLQPLTQVDISSELSGVVRSVAVDENGTVKKGDVLAELDTTRITANVDRAQASVKVADAQVGQARTTLAEAEQTLTRSEALAKRGMVAPQALETATATRDRAKASVAVAEANMAITVAELKLQQTDLAKSRIYAPIDGIVLTRSVDPGQTVASSLQAPVLFVLAADLRKMELKAAIDEADIGSVKVGQAARFTVDAFPDRSFDAAIRDISFASVTTEGVVTYDARLDVDNAELLLRPGMTATVSVVTRKADDVLTVPVTAFRFTPPVERASRGWSLQRMFMPPGRPQGQERQRQRDTDGTRTLYVLKDGKPSAVKVKTGSTDGEMTEILSGLTEGDQVVTGIAGARN